ncbi:coiled-coil domain-containing protein 166-like [Mizuhopecten yessoensis]|uniref:coiled-coil domain-containing protein 166-like n=1 Tax=Mizuhopecten yessoensis TaxID=6573 RepID=UPI000B45EDC8|nr:coiled-coil domain-containing protein 166-like [Mizuhopecten yessoensis]
MPPKKKGGKKGKKGKGGKDDDGDEPKQKPATPEPTEKELILQQELEKVTTDLENARKKVEDLRKENDWLQQEANRVRNESHEYMSYMEKKTSKRQTTIITLSDHNKQQIRNILLEKEIMEREFDERKQTLEILLLEKQNSLKKTKDELGDLTPLKTLQTEQLNKIKELEKEVMQMRTKHSETIQSLKSTFLRDKREFQNDSENRISTLQKKANKEAIQCLTDHTNAIKTENRNLRRELLELIKTTRAYQEHKRELEEQRKQLLREQQYAEDLKKLRNTRQHKVLKSFGLAAEGEPEDEHSKPALETSVETG